MSVEWGWIPKVQETGGCSARVGAWFGTLRGHAAGGRLFLIPDDATSAFRRSAAVHLMRFDVLKHREELSKCYSKTSQFSNFEQCIEFYTSILWELADFWCPRKPKNPIKQGANGHNDFF
jgi:hypothetical protein